MKFKQLGLLGLCLLMLFGCAKANTNQETNSIRKKWCKSRKNFL